MKQIKARKKVTQMRWIGAALLAASACLVYLFWTWDSGARDQGAQEGATARVSNEVHPAPVPAELLRLADLESVRSEAAEPAAASAGLQRAAKETRSNFNSTLRGRFVDVAGLPQAGVELSCAVPGLQVKSDNFGRFTLEVSLPMAARRAALQLLAKKAGFAQLSLEVTLAAAELDLGDIVLSAGGAARGRVVDLEDRGFAGAEVLATIVLPAAFLHRDRRPNDPLQRSVSDADGYFSLEGLPLGDVRLWAGAPGMLWAYQDDVRITAAGVFPDALLRLLPSVDAEAISMIVLDPNGVGVPGAQVRYQYNSPNSGGSGTLLMDSKGESRHRLTPRLAHDYSASHPEQRFRPAVARGVPPGTTNLVLQLGAPAELLVSVREQSGAPVAEFSLNTLTYAEGRQLAGESVSVKLGDLPAGRAKLQLPMERFEIHAEAPGYQRASIGPFEPAGVGSSLEIELQGLARVSGSVVDQAGQAVGGARVGLHELVAQDTALTVNGFPCRSHKGAEASGETDSMGRFAITLREAGDYYLRASKAGLAPAESGPYALLPEVGARELRLVLTQGGSIEGRVLLPGSKSAAGQVLGVSRGDGFGFTQRADAAGCFRFEHLTPGAWFVEARREELSPASTVSSSGGSAQEAMPWSCVVREASSTNFDLDLRKLPEVSVRGRLRFSAVGVDDFQVLLQRKIQADEDLRPRTIASDRSDAEGRFQLELEEPGLQTLFISGSWQGSSLELHRDVVLNPGVQELDLNLEMGRVEGTSLLLSGEELKCSFSGADGWTFAAGASVGKDGRFVFPAVPAGSAVVHSTGAGAPEYRVEIAAGQTTLLDL